MNIVVRRVSALGDVLCTTPIIARLRQEHPSAFITVETAYPNVFFGNPHLSAINVHKPRDKTVNLDMAHERNRGVHAIDAYMLEAFGDRGEGFDKSIVFKYDEAPDLGVDWSRAITLHANHTWQNRMLPNAWWDKVASALTETGYEVVVLGTQIDYCPRVRKIDTRGILDLQRQAAVIAASRALICGASGLFILAAATPTPCVVPITINTVDTALPWRRGVQGGGYFPLVADVPCLGCSERAGPVTFLGCERGDYACIATLKEDRAIELTLQAAM